jgi:hypothetical protein
LTKELADSLRNDLVENNDSTGPITQDNFEEYSSDEFVDHHSRRDDAHFPDVRGLPGQDDVPNTLSRDKSKLLDILNSGDPEKLAPPANTKTARMASEDGSLTSHSGMGLNVSEIAKN